MRLSKTDPESMVKKLQRQEKQLSRDIKAIIKEHDSYSFGGSKENISDWFDSLPIQDLRDSLERQHNYPRRHPSLRDLKHKFGLRKLFTKTADKLQEVQTELKIATIDSIINKIAKVQNG